MSMFIKEQMINAICDYMELLDWEVADVASRTGRRKEEVLDCLNKPQNYEEVYYMGLEAELRSKFNKQSK